MDRTINVTLEVRPATLEDGETIFGLWVNAANWLLEKGINQWHPDFFRLEQVKEWMDSGADVYVASLNGGIVGTLLLCWTDPDVWGEQNSEDAGYIHRFATSRAHAGLGIGSKLLKWAEAEIASRGKSSARLDCIAENSALNAYYRNNGYMLVGNKHWPNGWKANLYEKIIVMEQ
ncbi:GNAT family N-acetyltransferase [Paenibacillus sp. NEAU-GSW1]|uniref:GNAT family N-acetyltransferase n=1 Tax=Paenibacillus sp. NEAU-GSW1 TaxID=2682486 RepID=UPI0012E25D04|nr:GNAT family N-acetyltransferase [Paenibacillus sp. NEAU-GSW1]MUT67388.1 GNAT family N-acetyltransferase [Paenibacillus sp. NEAU-GSW1]